MRRSNVVTGTTTTLAPRLGWLGWGAGDPDWRRGESGYDVDETDELPPPEGW
jgi:hypothetical protein